MPIAARAAFLMGALLLCALLCAPLTSRAHPMGNVGISQHSDLRLSPQRIELAYTLDYAEIPTFQEIHKHRLVAQAGHSTLTRYLERLGEDLRKGLKLVINQQAVPVILDQACTAQFEDGAAGMHTMRVQCRFSSALPNHAKRFTLHYADGNYARRSGWKEIILNAQAGVSISARSVPSQDRSAALTRYPSDALNAPPQVLEASAEFHTAK